MKRSNPKSFVLVYILLHSDVYLCRLTYISALERAQNAERTISIDEMTGIQATELLEKDLPMRPGKVERREFEYVRHGTQSLSKSAQINITM